MELSRALPVEPCADELLRRVADLVGETATAAVAFSGGADSALALAACATTGRLSSAEKLDLYRAHAGAP